MASQDNNPFSGDVHQAINPWSWGAAMLNQAGFININNVESSNPKLEKDIVENIASYGSQLATILPVLELFVATVDTDKLDQVQQANIQAFNDLIHRLKLLKESRRQNLTVQDTEKFAARLKHLRNEDKSLYDLCIKTLKNMD